MYRVINVASNEVLSLDEITTLAEAKTVAAEIESHESEPEVTIQESINGEWVTVKNDSAEATANLRIANRFGSFVVEGLDRNGVWVSIEPGQCTFVTREEAQEYADRWMDCTDGLTQAEDLVV